MAGLPFGVHEIATFDYIGMVPRAAETASVAESNHLVSSLIAKGLRRARTVRLAPSTALSLKHIRWAGNPYDLTG